VLEPISTKGLTTADVDKLANDVRELMLREIVSLTAEVRNTPIAMSAAQDRSATGKSTGLDHKEL
jgi:lysophosphatidate acyltransferase